MSSDQVSASEVFSRYPAGRFETDGPFSGEAFRKIIERLLEEREVLALKLDWPLQPGSSFLEESFGGLVRVSGFTMEQLDKRLKLDGVLADEIRNYMTEAEQVRKRSTNG